MSRFSLILALLAIAIIVGFTGSIANATDVTVSAASEDQLPVSSTSFTFPATGGTWSFSFGRTYTDGGCRIYLQIVGTSLLNYYNAADFDPGTAFITGGSVIPASAPNRIIIGIVSNSVLVDFSYITATATY